MEFDNEQVYFSCILPYNIAKPLIHFTVTAEILASSLAYFHGFVK